VRGPSAVRLQPGHTAGGEGGGKRSGSGGRGLQQSADRTAPAVHKAGIHIKDRGGGGD